MISADQALQIVLDNAAPLGVERVPLVSALGRVLAEDILSRRDIPGFDNSAMDGYAVRSTDVDSASESRPVRLTVVETVAAGMMPTQSVGPGQAARTMTGAPIAPGADAIVQVERTRSDRPDTVEILAAVPPGASVRPRGEDVRSGQTVIESGRILGAPDLGVIASVNRPMVNVQRRPRVAIVATGDELVDVDTVPTGAQVVNSSAYALSGGVVEAGGEASILRIARDRPEEIRERLSEAVRFDMVLSTGGVSVGQFDHVKGALDQLGMRTLFHGVAQKPGRPLKFGLIEGRPVFGLPGNPVSTMVCFYLYVRAALQKMGGRQVTGLPRVRVICSTDIKVSSNVTEFIRVRLERREDGIYAEPTGNQGSGIMSSLSRADALLIGPAKVDSLHAGDEAVAMLLNPYAAAEVEAFFEERRLHKS